jgi:cytochrome c peroxidase
MNLTYPSLKTRIVFALLPLTFAAAGDKRLEIPLGLDSFLPVPEANPLTPERAAMGRDLFSDRRLSRDQTISCATCHDPKRAFTDGKPVAEGVFGRRGQRRVPAIVNRGYGKSFFWDGRIATLEEQVLQPIVSPAEMDMTVEEALARLRVESRYAALTRDGLAQALASYVRTILAGGSPYDRYIAGDRDALPEPARTGLQIFRRKGNCASCHLGPNLTDERYHNTGVAWRQGRFSDAGRFIATKRDQDRGAFKTPTLRQVAGRAPYMHDGSIATLEEVVEHYDRGGNRNPNLDSELQPLGLSHDEKQALVAFLRSLSGVVREGM